MAHRIIYKPSGIILSSTLGDIAIAVDGDFVDVTLTATAKTILSERYYAYGGNVTLYDLAPLIEAEMRSSGQTFAQFTLRVFTDTTNNKADSCVLHILYCDRLIIHADVPTFLSENFLTTLPMRRIAPNSSLSLFLFAQAGESLAYTISFRAFVPEINGYIHGEKQYDTGKTASYLGDVQLNISLNDICDYIGKTYTAAVQHPFELQSITITCGQRSITFFIDPELENFSSFYFRNCFNVWDVALFPAVTTAKTAVERSTAIINGYSQFYNQTNNKTYEVEVGPLTSDEAEWIDQLFTSYDVFRIEFDPTSPDDPYLFAPILITDSTCEVKDTDDKLNSVKFTWRYADNRPYLRLSASPGIFTSPYNPVFS